MFWMTAVQSEGDPALRKAKPFGRPANYFPLLRIPHGRQNSRLAGLA